MLSEHVLRWLHWFGYLLTAVLGFWEPCWELFWSITQGSIRSNCLRSIRNEVYDWLNFFSRSRLRSNRSLTFSVKVDQKPLGQSEIQLLRVLRFILRNRVHCTKQNKDQTYSSLLHWKVLVQFQTFLKMNSTVFGKLILDQLHNKTIHCCCCLRLGQMNYNTLNAKRNIKINDKDFLF